MKDLPWPVLGSVTEDGEVVVEIVGSRSQAVVLGRFTPRGFQYRTVPVSDFEFYSWAITDGVTPTDILETCMRYWNPDVVVESTSPRWWMFDAVNVATGAEHSCTEMNIEGGLESWLLDFRFAVA